MWSGPAVSQGTAAGHLFISLFARRQCSCLWRRNSIFILSFCVILSCLHQHHRSPNHYLPLFYPHTYSSLSLALILRPFGFLTTSVERAKKYLSISLCRPKATVFWLNIVWILSTFQCVITSRIIGKRVSSASHRHMRSVADRFGVAQGHRWKEWKVSTNR